MGTGIDYERAASHGGYASGRGFSERVVGALALVIVSACGAAPQRARTHAPADPSQAGTSIEADRAWWDASAATPRSPVEVSFDPIGMHPYACVREDGALWTYLDDDMGVRVSPDGRITDSHGAEVGTIGRDGVLHDRDMPEARIDDDGRLFCRSRTAPFARIDRSGVIVHVADGQRMGTLQGSNDWRRNRRAAFLLLALVCMADS